MDWIQIYCIIWLVIQFIGRLSKIGDVEVVSLDSVIDGYGWWLVGVSPIIGRIFNLW